MASLEGFAGDEPLKVYLPRRFLNVLTDAVIVQYNAGVGVRLNLMKKNPQPGSNIPAIEFV